MGIIAVISKFKMTQCIAHLYLQGNDRQVGSARTTTAVLKSPYISRIYYYPILHHQPAPIVKAPPKRWRYLDQPQRFFRIQELQRDTKSTNTKSSKCDALPGRKLPAALLKATAIRLLYARFHEGLFNST